MTTTPYLECGEWDAARWVWVPGEEGETWAGEAARAVWGDSGVVPRTGEIEGLARELAHCARRCPSAYPGFEVLLHLPGPRDTPLPVYLGGYPCGGDVEDELRQAGGEADPDAVEPPLVEEFTTERLGAGRRVLRYTADPGDPDRALLAALRYAWHLPGADAIGCLFTVHPQPGRLLTALDDLDELARGLRPVTG